jgi:hypothetical protein
MALKAPRTLNRLPEPPPVERVPGRAPAASKGRTRLTPINGKGKPVGTREGRTQVAFFINRQAKKQLDQFRIDEDTSLQALMIEAVNLLLEKKGKRPNAE